MEIAMSIKRIAELAGTSPSTVSRVLNNPGHFCQTPGLSEQIWKIAGELNYLPNPAARALRKGERKPSSPLTVDFFLTRFDSMDQDPFFQELFRCLQKELQQTQCLLGEVLSTADIWNLGTETYCTVPYKTMEKIHQEKTTPSPAFISRKENAGLILLGKCPQELIPLLKKRYAYLAGIDRNPTDFQYDEVICSGEAAAKIAVEHLISLGHRKIAYIGDCTYESRYIGYYQALLAHQIPLDYQFIHPSKQTEEEGFHIMNTILSSLERPTAIFCANDCTAIGVLKALKRTRKHPDISVISIDNIEASAHTTPMLTTIDIPKQEMAHLALLSLLEQQKGAHRECVRIELPCRLLERESCNCATIEMKNMN